MADIRRHADRPHDRRIKDNGAKKLRKVTDLISWLRIVTELVRRLELWEQEL